MTWAVLRPCESYEKVRKTTFSNYSISHRYLLDLIKTRWKVKQRNNKHKFLPHFLLIQIRIRYALQTTSNYHGKLIVKPTPLFVFIKLPFEPPYTLLLNALEYLRIIWYLICIPSDTFPIRLRTCYKIFFFIKRKLWVWTNKIDAICRYWNTRSQPGQIK